MTEEKIVMSGEQLVQAYRNEQVKFEMISEKLRQLQALFSEANKAEEAVNEIKKAEKNEKIIVDLGAGVYVEAALAGNEQFKTAFAGSIMMNSDSKKVLEYLKNQKEMIQKEMEAAAKEQEKTATALNEISRYLQIAEMQAQKKIAGAAQESK